MAKSVEVLAEQAIGVVASYPWSGQIVEQVYTARRPIFDNGANNGTQVSLTAVWEGAEKLAGDPAVRCIVLERNPYREGLKNAVLLRIDQVNSKGSTRFDFVFRKGVEPTIINKKGVEASIGRNRRRLALTVLGNIAQLKADCP